MAEEQSSSVTAPAASRIVTTTTTTTTTSIGGSSSMLLREAVLARYSARLFHSKPVPRILIDKALELAKHSPSDSNTQVWRLFIVTGDALKRLTTDLMERAKTAPDLKFADLPPEFNSYRAALGARIYGEGWGLKRGDQRDAVLTNFQFFGAPVGVIVCMNRSLIPEQTMSVGMYMQTFLLALTELGLGSCPMFSIATFPEVVHKALGIPEDLRVLCGIAVGYEDLKAGVNKVRSDRDPVDKHTVWLSD